MLSCPAKKENEKKGNNRRIVQVPDGAADMYYVTTTCYRFLDFVPLVDDGPRALPSLVSLSFQFQISFRNVFKAIRLCCPAAASQMASVNQVQPFVQNRSPKAKTLDALQLICLVCLFFRLPLTCASSLLITQSLSMIALIKRLYGRHCI